MYKIIGVQRHSIANEALQYDS